MTFTNDTTSPTDQALRAAAAAGIELPEEVTAAMVVTRTIRHAQGEALPGTPALPGAVLDVAAAIADYAAATLAHATATSSVNARRQAAAALQPVADAGLATVVRAAVPEMIVAVVDGFNERWQHFIANPDFDPVGQAFRLDRLHDARHVLGALAGERLDERIAALVVFAVAEPRPGQIEGRPLADVLYRWACFNPAPLTRWRDSLPQLPVEMVGPAGVAPRVEAVRSWTTAPPARQAGRAGARYDRPLPTGALQAAG
ncbi:MAG: hypothetical protein ACR2MN_07280 [Acidimicrobiales bacterium]